MNPSLKRTLVCLLIIASLLAGCSLPELLPVSTPTENPSSSEPGSEELDSPTLESELNSGDVCLSSEGDYLSFIDEQRGYCLLYPSSWTASPDYARGAEVVSFTAPLPETPPAMEYVLASLTIEFNGPAEGYDATSYAAQWMAYYMPGTIPVQSYTTIGGGQALAAEELSIGMLPQRGVFLIANGYRYFLRMSQPGYLTSEEDTLINQMLQSVRFFTPQGSFTYIQPEDVCPQRGAGNYVHISRIDGYCLLVPEELQPEQTFPGRFEGGPVWMRHPSFGDVKTSLTIGSYGYYPGQTPRQALASWLRDASISEPVDLTVGGYPAITFNNYRDPWDDNITFVSVDGHLLTILVQPYEPDQWPDGIPFFNAARDLALSTITFFTPWH